MSIYVTTNISRLDGVVHVPVDWRRCAPHVLMSELPTITVSWDKDWATFELQTDATLGEFIDVLSSDVSPDINAHWWFHDPDAQVTLEVLTKRAVEELERFVYSIFVRDLPYRVECYQNIDTNNFVCVPYHVNPMLGKNWEEISYYVCADLLMEKTYLYGAKE